MENPTAITSAVAKSKWSVTKKLVATETINTPHVSVQTLEVGEVVQTPALSTLVGDGVTNDVVALNAILAKGGHIRLWPATFCILGDDLYIQSNTVLDLNGATIKYDMDNHVSGDRIMLKLDGVNNVIIRNGIIDANAVFDGIFPNGYINGLGITGTNILVENVEIKHCRTGFNLSNSENVVFQNVNSHGNKERSATVYNNQNVTMINCILNGGAHVLVFQENVNMKWFGCTIMLDWEHMSPTGSVNFYIKYNSVVGNTEHIIYGYNNDGLKPYNGGITEMYWSGCKFLKRFGNPSGIKLMGSQRFDGCVFATSIVFHEYNSSSRPNPTYMAGKTAGILNNCVWINERPDVDSLTINCDWNENDLRDEYQRHQFLFTNNIAYVPLQIRCETTSVGSAYHISNSVFHSRLHMYFTRYVSWDTPEKILITGNEFFGPLIIGEAYTGASLSKENRIVIEGCKFNGMEEITYLADINGLWDPTGGLPVNPEIGVRYIATATDGVSGWTAEYIYEWDGGAWVETVPTRTNVAWVLNYDNQVPVLVRWNGDIEHRIIDVMYYPADATTPQLLIQICGKTLVKSCLFDSAKPVGTVTDRIPIRFAQPVETVLQTAPYMVIVESCEGALNLIETDLLANDVGRVYFTKNITEIAGFTDFGTDFNITGGTPAGTVMYSLGDNFNRAGDVFTAY